jgi:predicted dehydrogenase
MLAIIGFGDHVQRNILPALNKIDSVSIKYIFVRDIQKYKSLYDFNFIDDFTKILADDEISAVYIATPINNHYQYAKKALEAGKKVLCEKALTTNLTQTEELVEIAKATNTKLQEVVMYQYHNQYLWIKNYLQEKSKSRLLKIHTSFKIPHLPLGNIRYSKEQGGGALLDVGFYPISLLLSLLGMPTSIKSILLSQDDYNVDLFGEAIFSYDGFYGVAEWGIGCQYSNQITLEFEDHKVCIERAFSKPTTLETTVLIKKNNSIQEEIVTNCCDHFFLLFLDFFKDATNDESQLDNILARAKAIDVIKNKA